MLARIQSLETIATKQNDNYKSVLKELGDLKKLVKTGDRIDDNSELQNAKQELKILKTSIYDHEKTQQDMHLDVQNLQEQVNDHDLRFDEHFMLMLCIYQTLNHTTVRWQHTPIRWQHTSVRWQYTSIQWQ